MARKLFAQSPHVIPSQILILENQFYVIGLTFGFIDLLQVVNGPWKGSMYRLNVTLVTVISVLFRMLKVSATDFGSDICHGVCGFVGQRKVHDAYLELGAYRLVIIERDEEEPRFIMKLSVSHTQ